jgi:arginase
MKSVLVPYHLAEPLPQLAEAFVADDAVVVAKGPADAMVTRLGEQIASRVTAHAEPSLVLSGDATTASLPVLAGLQRRGLVPSVIWLGAHAGFHTARTTRTGYLGGMTLAMIVGRAGAALRDALALHPVAEEACVVVGARDVDAAERDALGRAPIAQIALDQLGVTPLPPSPWYVHLDLDLLDPSELPPLRFPVPGGPSTGVVAAALQRLATRGTIAALGIACTLAPKGFAERDPLASVRRLVDAAFGEARGV